MSVQKWQKSWIDSNAALPDDDNSNDLVVNLLTNNEFDLVKTHGCVFNILSLVKPSPEESFNYADKQVFFEQVRAPIKLLRTELNKMAEEFQSIDTQREDGIRLEKNYRLKQEQWNLAMKNAASDTYESVYSKAEDSCS
jgi:hypothetical protein